MHLDPKSGSEAKNDSEFAGRHRSESFGPTEWCLSPLPQFLPQTEIQLHSSFLAGTVLPLATVSGLGCTRTESTDWGLRLACFVTLFSHGEVLCRLPCVPFSSPQNRAINIPRT